MANAKVKWAGDRGFIGVDSTNHALLISSPRAGMYRALIF